MSSRRSPGVRPAEAGARSPRWAGAELGAAGGRESVEGGRGFGVRGSAGGEGMGNASSALPGGRVSWEGGVSLTSGPAGVCLEGEEGVCFMAAELGGVVCPHSCLSGPRPGKFHCCVSLAAVEVVLGGSP